MRTCGGKTPPASGDRRRLTLTCFGLLVAATVTSPAHADADTNVPSPQSPPVPPPQPQPPAVLLAPAGDTTVRTATAAYTHVPAADHPRRVETTYRVETMEPAMNTGTASTWESAEYSAQEGLGLIRASTGYAVRNAGKPGGGGRTIAIIEFRTVARDDDDFNGHPDLRDVTVVDVNGRGRVGGHATRTAGIAAARRNGWGIHGVAYNANIVSIAYGAYGQRDLEAILASVAGLTGRYGPTPSYMWNADPAASAHVVNLSFGTANSSVRSSILNGMKLVAGEGRVMVASVGNDSDSEPRGYIASSVADEGIAGHAIAVGALNRPGNAAASWSNRCGSVKRWCIFAPGQDIYSTNAASTYLGTSRGFNRNRGTSFAAPHVSGAAAVVWAAFPDKTGAEIVQRLLDTARQVDTANGNYDATTGLSPIYGHGALDLGAALNPNTAWPQ